MLERFSIRLRHLLRSWPVGLQPAGAKRPAGRVRRPSAHALVPRASTWMPGTRPGMIERGNDARRTEPAPRHLETILGSLFAGLVVSVLALSAVAAEPIKIGFG